ncbi:MAG: type VI secretion system ATPase TssH, partial [Oscillospiraceae bacterium]|nr:type VI secretion system ATPase TssH [Oscillospiraceae bacterium]
MNANKMTQKTLEAMQNAQSLCTGYQNNAVEPVHILTALLQQSDGLIPQLVQRIGISAQGFAKAAEKEVAALPHVTGSGRQPGMVYISNDT